MTPFQCVECHFVNLQGRLPDKLAHRNSLAKVAITRAILDSLWSRERSTVNANRLEGLRYLDELRKLGLEGSAYPARGFSQSGPMGYDGGLCHAGTVDGGGTQFRYYPV